MVKIILDQRERNGIEKILKRKGAEVEINTLEVGDYILSNDVAIERKTISDFLQSLIDRRLFQQAQNMVANFNKPLFIVEGDLTEIYSLRNINANAIRAAISSLVLDYKTPVIFTSDIDETASFLLTIAKREQEQKNKEVSLRGSKRQLALHEQQQFFIEGLPNIGPNLAKILLKKFKTPKKVLSASEKRLSKIDKIGPKKIKGIKQILESEYSEDKD